MVTGQDFGDASVRNSELSGDVTWSDAQLGQLDDPKSDRVWEGAEIS